MMDLCGEDTSTQLNAADETAAFQVDDAVSVPAFAPAAASGGARRADSS